jgi:hypothetical protein
LKHKKDALAKILADKEEVLEKDTMAKMTADQDAKALEDKKTETELSKKKRRTKNTKDKDRTQKGLMVDTGNPGDDDAPAVDEAMLDADGDDDAWKEVDKSGKGKTKKQREKAAETKKATKAAKQAVKALKAAQVAASAAANDAYNGSNKGKQSNPRAGTTGPTRNKDSQYHTCFILNVGGQEGANIPDMQRNAMKAVFSVGKDIEEIFFELLSSFVPAPLLVSEDALPVRATKQRECICVVSGGSNVNKAGKRL